MEKVIINFISEDFKDYHYGDPWNCPLAKAIQRQLGIEGACALTRVVKSDFQKIFAFPEEQWNERIATNLQKLSEMNNSVLYSLELEKL